MSNLKKVFIAGHNGMVGRALCKILRTNLKIQIITKDKKHLNFIDQHQVRNFFKKNKIDEVYIAAAKVGGIMANYNYPADFIYQNIMIQSNIIEAAFSSGVKKILFLGSSCIYPKFAEQPIVEDSLLKSSLEKTNEPYAIAKIAGLKMCESFNRQFGTDFRSVMPTNLYGPWDNFHLKNSHVMPALIRRFYEAKINNSKEIILWGTGEPLREFLHVDDMAEACVHVMSLDKNIFFQNNNFSHINIGSGSDISIKDLAMLICDIVGFKGKIKWDKDKPDGTPKKLMDSSRLYSLGWKPKIDLKSGIKNTYEWFLANKNLEKSF